ncbi:polysaccharide pyruvyl transferase family protein [Bacteroides nordii]|uniref:polysaccharide pyruvyl transferase family protein n=1 Tax=Bacteroides nordii TaxID=291645 RepID=UPI00399AF59E
MKIILTTIVDNINFGTYLQAYATVRKLEERGHQITVLNYIRPYLTGKNYALAYLNDKSKSIIIRYLYCIGYMSLNRYMTWQVKRFLQSHSNMTKKYYDAETIKKQLPPYDLYLTGSDQVWNSAHNFGIDTIFFWKGIKGKKASYAASIGLESFPEDQRYEIKKLLSEYEKISVRESFGIKALNQLGLINVQQVLDPTLLLNKEEWKSIAVKSKFHKCESYLLIYSVELNRTSAVINIAQKIAAERNLKLYMVCPTFKFKKKINVDRVFNLASVETFLSLFSQADYIVASSFHGTAFAINFNRQFVTVSPERFSTRVNSLLELLQLKNRYIKDESEIPIENIEYKFINKKLNEERMASEAFITDITNL